MNSFAKFQEIPEPSALPAGQEDEERILVLSELERIVTSPCFRNAERSKQFLKYVVEHKLAGHPQQLKERTIGTDVFLRPKNYSTGEDAVVRVQAGEVRKKIEHYYQLAPSNSSVRIELPVGSYSPIFHWPSAMAPAEAPALPSLSPKAEPAAQKRHWARYIFIAACGLILAVGAGRVITTVHRATVQQPAYKSAIEQFWNPVFASQQPVAICLGANLLRPLGPIVQDAGSNTNTDSYLGAPIRDVYAALAISTLLGKIGKPSEVRIGSNCSFDDFRNSAAVAVGAYNNKLTLQLLASSHLAFAHSKGQYMIRELPPGNRVWKARIGTDGEGNDDFAIVSRQLDSRTGQFTVAVAGTGPYATQSAGNFVSNPQYLEQGLQNAPSDWQKKNLVIILETIGADSIAGPPTVVASYVW
jgi:hypothetical protein